MSYTPTTVTALNFEHAIEKNLTDIYDEIARKLSVSQRNQLLGDLNLGGFKFGNTPIPELGSEPVNKVFMENPGGDTSDDPWTAAILDLNPTIYSLTPLVGTPNAGSLGGVLTGDVGGSQAVVASIIPAVGGSLAVANGPADGVVIQSAQYASPGGASTPAALTAGAWVNPGPTDVFSIGLSIQLGTFSVAVASDGAGNWQFFSAQFGGDFYLTTGVTGAQTGTGDSLIVTWDGATFPKLYVNGVDINEPFGGSFPSSLPTPPDFVQGGEPTAVGEFATIQGLFVTEQELTPAAVAVLHTTGATP